MADHLPQPSMPRSSLVISRGTRWRRRCLGWLGHGVLLAITSSSAILVLFIFFFIIRDALPFFQQRGIAEMFTSTDWSPDKGNYGALSIIFGSAMVTFGAVIVAVPLGVVAAACLSDMLPFSIRQITKPIIEVLAAIPSVAYGFFAFVIFAPFLQERGGGALAVTLWIVGVPLGGITCWVMADLLANRLASQERHVRVRMITFLVLLFLVMGGLLWGGLEVLALQINSGTNALNVSIVLGIMALPTVVSVSEDALQAVRRELREGAYALGATRAETLLWVVLPAARSGLAAAAILGVMRAVGETMVVWMAAGNSAQIPQPWFNFLDPIRTLTATIAGDMGEASQIKGSTHYHVLFAMGMLLLIVSYFFNFISERIIRVSRARS
jgi:phosphate transport system permease protein